MISGCQLYITALIAIVCLPLCLAQVLGQNVTASLPFLDMSLSVDRRVDDLVSRMTLEEKVSQMINSAPAIDRLGVPEYDWWNECLHGVARAGKATVFPQAIGLAATWDTDMMRRFAVAVSDEARAKHHDFLRKGKRGMYQGLTFWSPNINIFRDPRWGRGMETYGEDPYLTGKLAVEFVKGLQGDDPQYLKVVATSKHFAVHSGPEPNRHTFNAITDERDLWETYLPHFQMSIEEGGAYSVMGAYNRYMGEACCANEKLLKEILRKQWGFEGYVVSDCGAIYDIYKNHRIVDTSPEAAAVAVKAGCDLNCGTVYENLTEAVRLGLITEEEIDVSVKRLFTARFKLGMFDDPGKVPYAQIPYDVVDCKKHRELALEAARKSIVLLKNEGDVLPLSKNIGTIAVIGPNANDIEVLLGNYNGNPVDPVTPLRGIKEKVSKNTNVIYAPGCELAKNFPMFDVITASAYYTSADRENNGLKAEYFDNRDFKGNPVLTRTEKNIDARWWDSAPVEGFDDDNFGVRWSGYLVPPVTGTYNIGANGYTGFRVHFNGKQLLVFDSIYHPSTVYEQVTLEAGISYEIKVEYYDREGDAHMKMLWSVPGRNYEQEALQAAQESDAVIMVMGLSPRLEGEEMKIHIEGFEGGDRLDIKLPEVQENLMKKIHALGKPVVLVILNGSAVAINWADEHIPAIVEAWYPGQAAGTALADVLFGDYNPAGRLPVTFYQSVDQLPTFEDYTMKGKTYRYFGGDPLYTFGYGLSYTTFSYSGLKLPETVKPGDTVPVAVTVQNTGDLAGEEVVQFYVSDVDASAPVPIRSLKGFERIALKPGEKRVVEFSLSPKQLSLINNDLKRVIEPGIFEVSVGGMQPGGARTTAVVTTEVITGRFEVTGKVTEVNNGL